MIIKSTPQPGPEQVDIAWMHMQSLLDKHLPVHQHKKSIITFVTRIAAVFIMLLQIPVAFKMGNVLQESNHGMASVTIQKDHENDLPTLKANLNKNKEDHQPLFSNHFNHIEARNFSTINTERIELPSQSTILSDDKRSEVLFAFGPDEVNERKVDIDFSSLKRSALPVDIKLAMQPNAPLLVQDMVQSNSSLLRTRSAQYLDIPLQVSVPVSDKIELHAGVQVSYLQSVQTKETSAVGLPVDMPTVTTLTSPIARTLPIPSLNENVTVRNMNQGINAGMSYKTSLGEVGVKYQYGVGQIYGIQNNSQQRHMVSVSFKCPIR